MEDSRLKGYTVAVTHPTMPLTRTYCYNCGKPKGWVTTESYEYMTALQIIVICDACEVKLGAMPLVKAPIAEVEPGFPPTGPKL